MEKPAYEELEPEFKKPLNPLNEKALSLIAKGVAPLPPSILVGSWCYLLDHENQDLAEAAKKSLEGFPINTIKTVAKEKLPSWAMFRLGHHFKGNEEVLELILLNPMTPNEFVLEVASVVPEKLTIIIANNQERLIDTPEIICELEKNPNNLKSNTDKLRQFLKIAGIFVPGGQDDPTLDEELNEEEKQKKEEEIKEKLDAEDLPEEKKMNLYKYIQLINVGAKVKLALKGNKEARSILIKDSNKTVAAAVLKSPRITENEIIHYSNLKNVADDVIRLIARNPTWTKNYQIKLNLINHPKAPLQTVMAFVKFLNLRDLQGVTKSRTVPGPVRKFAKQLLQQKRK